MPNKLTDQDYCNGAKELGCSVAAIKAVAEVESSGGGYLADGRIKIRFEGHKFREFTNQKYDKDHPDVSYPYSQMGSKAHGYDAFDKAFALDSTAALLATSWGKFQPMGFTHGEVGFATVNAFVDFLKASEGNQLIAFIRLVKARGLADELKRARKSDFQTFKTVYNGSGANNYAQKMYDAYLRYKKVKVNCDGATGEIASDTTIPEDGGSAGDSSNVGTTTTTQQTDSTTVVTGSDLDTPADVTAIRPYQGIGFWPVIKRDLGAAMGGNLTFQGLTTVMNQLTGIPEWLAPLIAKFAFVILIGTVLYFIFRLVNYVVWIFNERHRVKIEAQYKADPLKKDINWVGNN
jgi:hypothetical protein